MFASAIIYVCGNNENDTLLIRATNLEISVINIESTVLKLIRKLAQVCTMPISQMCLAELSLSTSRLFKICITKWKVFWSSNWSLTNTCSAFLIGSKMSNCGCWLEAYTLLIDSASSF